ncbi:MAG: RodZ domain-containing protein [Desulfosoma sp.]
MDALKDIGAFLEGERKRQKISLEELSEHTRISVRMLQALEAGEYEVIGTPLLIRGFLKVYCQALGVDPRPILEEYGSEIGRYDNEGERLRRYQTWMRGVRKESGTFLVLFLVLALGVTAAGLWAVWWPKYQMKRAATSKAPFEAVYPQQELPGDLARVRGAEGTGESSGTERAGAHGVLPEGENPVPLPESGLGGPDVRDFEEITQPKQEGGTGANLEPKTSRTLTTSLPHETAASSDVKTYKTAMEPGEIPAATHTLLIVALEEAWIQVQVDDEKPQGRILKPGESAQWILSQSAQLWTGNAGGIHVSWDGKPLKPLGKKGEVLRVKLPNPRYLENP